MNGDKDLAARFPTVLNLGGIHVTVDHLQLRNTPSRIAWFRYSQQVCVLKGWALAQHGM